jgi:hypothetical protein
MLQPQSSKMPVTLFQFQLQSRPHVVVDSAQQPHDLTGRAASQMPARTREPLLGVEMLAARWPHLPSMSLRLSYVRVTSPPPS